MILGPCKLVTLTVTKISPQRRGSVTDTYASWLAENGADLKLIQEILRHSNIKQTMRYTHLMPEVIAEKAVKAMDQITIPEFKVYE